MQARLNKFTHLDSDDAQRFVHGRMSEEEALFTIEHQHSCECCAMTIRLAEVEERRDARGRRIYALEA